MTQSTTMATSPNNQGVLPTLPLVSLQSKDHEELLNIIDKLRSQGISRYIDLPQLIVCGDQSSGKSSVLEAVSGLRFPTKDNLCTRFATELVLRRVATESATVTIVPDPGRSEQEITKLSAFKPSTTVYDDFGSIIEEAGEAMGLGPAKVFSTDILRVEISGPTQPHLTLVDLPGMFHAGELSSRVIVDVFVHPNVSVALSHLLKLLSGNEFFIRIEKASPGERCCMCSYGSRSRLKGKEIHVFSLPVN